jgi:hypothetical protein
MHEPSCALIRQAIAVCADTGNVLVGPGSAAHAALVGAFAQVPLEQNVMVARVFTPAAP